MEAELEKEIGDEQRLEDLLNDTKDFLGTVGQGPSPRRRKTQRVEDIEKELIQSLNGNSGTSGKSENENLMGDATQKLVLSPKMSEDELENDHRKQKKAKSSANKRRKEEIKEADPLMLKSKKKKIIEEDESKSESDSPLKTPSKFKSKTPKNVSQEISELSIEASKSSLHLSDVLDEELKKGSPKKKRVKKDNDEMVFSGDEDESEVENHKTPESSEHQTSYDGDQQTNKALETIKEVSDEEDSIADSGQVKRRAIRTPSDIFNDSPSKISLKKSKIKS